MNSRRSFRKFCLLIDLLSRAHQLLLTGTTVTKRDLYYQNPGLYGNQRTVDVLVDDLAVLLRCSRDDLNIIATSKGLATGDFILKGESGNGREMQIPALTNAIDVVLPQPRPSFVLVVEKHASFQNIFTHGLPFSHILITGKGFPDMGTRKFLRRLVADLEIPAFALMDGDPHGIEIMCTYKYGSMSLAHEARESTVPSLEWLGIRSGDVHEYHLPSTTFLPLTTKDREKLEQLLSRPYIRQQADVHCELERMWKMGMKVELESLDEISRDYLTQVYLPSKLQGHFLF
ncbi:unnamed protein product [Darwinula stevensoni]|uniref:DNA topoisomerase (ATP-hydrolyzing) n=1 Tax=Darwinula stevensoni TaxID=69355 RepID=A0A7R8XAB3_9CRUS|nr:unnamed protein product [Darwinula stevensoni]CAG0885406.1 unnamed protein product [Darwinula stevensoni]